MEDIEKDKVYFGLDAAEATEHKKEILEIVESLIKSEIASEKLNEFRIRERKMVSRLKNDLKEVCKDMHKFSEEIPHRVHHREISIHPAEKIDKEEKKKISKKISKARRYSEELQDIGKKIAKLSS